MRPMIWADIVDRASAKFERDVERTLSGEPNSLAVSVHQAIAQQIGLFATILRAEGFTALCEYEEAQDRRP